MARKRSNKVEPQPQLFDEELDPLAESLALTALSLVPGLGYRNLYRIKKSGMFFNDLFQINNPTLVQEELHIAEVRGSEKISQEICGEREQLLAQAEKMLTSYRSKQIEILHSEEDRFPDQLRTGESPAFWIYVAGNSTLLSKPAVAVVGTRTPTYDGIFLAQFISYLLAGTDIAIVSGLATGIDEAAHATALSAGVGTVAVLGTGILNHYPASTKGLRDDIIQHGGCLISEYMPNDQPSKDSFVLRNRIQAAMSRVVIPVEWRLQSGTAHTVRYALSLKRHVIGLELPGQKTEENEFLRSQRCPVFKVPHDAGELQDFLITATD